MMMMMELVLVGTSVLWKVAMWIMASTWAEDAGKYKIYKQSWTAQEMLERSSTHTYHMVSADATKGRSVVVQPECSLLFPVKSRRAAALSV